MEAVNPVVGNHQFGLFGRSHVRVSTHRSLLRSAERSEETAAANSSPYHALAAVQRLRKAFEALRPDRFRLQHIGGSGGSAAVLAEVTSTTAVDFGLQTRELRSTTEINTATTSYSQFRPVLQGTNDTVPWAGDSTALAVVSGNYDGSLGDGQMTVRVDSSATRGVDEIRLDVFSPADEYVETVTIAAADAVDKVFTLSSGLELTLGNGNVVAGDQFTVDLEVTSGSFVAGTPDWNGSTAQATISGTYFGGNGAGELTFRVNRGGVRGEDDLEIDVYDPNDSFIERIEIAATDALGQQYSLANGLRLRLGAGTLIEDETFGVNVHPLNPFGSGPTNPEWELGSSAITLRGTYDGSSGVGDLTIAAATTGTRGEDDLTLNVFRPDGSMLESVQVLATDAVDHVYSLSNGIELTVSAGTMIAGETVTTALTAEGVFSTLPNPVETTSEFTFHDVYDGSLGTETLQFEIVQGGTRGVDDLQLDIFRADGAFYETLNVSAADPVGQSFALSNGLELQVGSGTLNAGESFTIDLDHLTPGAVNPNGAFNSTGNDRPNFDSGFAVSEGSFEVNGVVIEVAADDTLNSVLNRITANVDGVTAEFDSQSESVLLTYSGGDPEADIVVSNDTSGLIAATKLDGAETTSTGGGRTDPLAEVATFSDVQSGSIVINEVEIGFDVDVDSLDDIIERINGSAAGVTAQLDSDNLELTISANGQSDLVIDSNGTQFFEAVSIVDGLYEFQSGSANSGVRQGVSTKSRDAIQAAFREISREMSNLFRDDGELSDLREELRGALLDSLPSQDSDILSRFGLGFDFSKSNDEVFRFDRTQSEQFARALRSAAHTKTLRTALFGASGSGADNDGFFDRMISSLRAAEQRLSLEYGSGSYARLNSGV